MHFHYNHLEESSMKSLREMSFQEYVDYMFDHTEVDGSVLLPVEVNLLGEQEASIFTVRWTRKDVEKVKSELTKHIQNIRDIARLGGGTNSTPEEARRILEGRPELYVFWRTYIRDMHREVDDTERESEAYRQELVKEAKQRLPQARIGAYELIAHSARLCDTLLRQAPEKLVNNEINHLAMDYVMTRYGISASATGVRVNGLEDLNRPKKSARKGGRSNSRKSLLPLLVADIIRERTNPLRPMTQERLGEILESYPYDLPVERKALGRVVETIVQERIGIQKCHKGIYYEKGGI